MTRVIACSRRRAAATSKRRAACSGRLSRYQGEEVAQFETELRWQFWGRLSLLGFGGVGSAWNDFERVDSPESVLSGGTGLRYELARRYGLHAGVDVAFSRDTTAFYIQVGSAWMRP